MKIHYFGMVVLSLLLSRAMQVRAADDPPAKTVTEAVKHDAKVVADATKDGAQHVAAAAKQVAHQVAAAAKEGAHEVAATAKRGAEKTKAAVQGEHADKPATKPDAAPASASPSH
jgi:hypothetical protein